MRGSVRDKRQQSFLHFSFGEIRVLSSLGRITHRRGRAELWAFKTMYLHTTGEASLFPSSYKLTKM